jgi:hypothetical protein
MTLEGPYGLFDLLNNFAKSHRYIRSLELFRKNSFDLLIRSLDFRSFDRPHSKERPRFFTIFVSVRDGDVIEGEIPGLVKISFSVIQRQ